MQTWWPIARGGGSEWFQRRRTRFLDEFTLLHVWLIDSRRFPAWRQWTGSSFPERSLMCQTTKTDCADLGQSYSIDGTRRAHREPVPGILHPVWCRHGGTRLESTRQASKCRNPSRKRVGHTEHRFQRLFPVCCRHSQSDCTWRGYMGKKLFVVRSGRQRAGHGTIDLFKIGR